MNAVCSTPMSLPELIAFVLFVFCLGLIFGHAFGVGAEKDSQ